MEKITEDLINWYEENKRDLPWRNTKNPYFIWVSEIMLQQTRVEAAKVYYERFIKRLPTLKDLANIKEDELLKLWEGLGYYSRVRNMQKTAKILIDSKKENLPNTKEELLLLPGIGEYTAGAILSIAYEKPAIAIDGNVYRVLGRYYRIEDSISKNKGYLKYASILKELLPEQKASFFTQSFMDLGSSICTPKNPKCHLCPLQNECLAKRNNVVLEYPKKEKKKEQKIEERCVYLFVYKNKIAIRKRESKGLLSSMYEFPNDLKTPSLMDVENELIQKNIDFKSVIEVGESKHVFSHIIWYMKGYSILLNKPLDNYKWVTKKELKENYSMPSAFSYYSDFIMKEIDE